ncbi:MAG: type II toxin-antitoxin system Phd/YefM family antitoxin [Spirochaetaceae bacterium]|nr:MAG: type II toxin-antitoxin system Phd/YefM family antitoxin [Spirochaetaceae bacterium]
MIEINIREAKTQFSNLLSRVETRHESFRICRNGKPVAELVPIKNQTVDSTVQHAELRGIRFLEDPTAPLAPDDWPEDRE